MNYIKSFAFNEQQIISKKELNKAGYTDSIINKFVNTGMINKISPSYYENVNYSASIIDFQYAKTYHKSSVIAMLSAAVYYGYTTHIIREIDIAIFRKNKPSSISGKFKFKVYYFNKERYETGIVRNYDGKDYFDIYDKEKTICDIVKYRNSIGMDVVAEILKNYLNDKDRDLNKLVVYAKKLKVYKVLANYLEVLLWAI